MLAKQAWRLLDKPDSLCARILKGRYYPEGDFLQAGCPASASTTWKAIITGGEVLKKGLIRRVGDGTTTEVWHDSWIHGSKTFKPVCNTGSDPIHLVSDLMTEDGEWNEEVIQRTFIAPDVLAILNMPRPRVAISDFWAWGYERSGVFTVRSAYRMLMEAHEDDLNQVGSSSQGEEVWKSLWRLKVQPKIRFFWWRVLKGFLPAKEELCRRHVGEDLTCPMCGHQEESLFHSLVLCDHVKLFWREAETFFEFKLPRLHPATWSRDLLDPSFIGKDRAAVIISVMWIIWSSRNKYTHEEVKYQPGRSMVLVKELIQALYIPSEAVDRENLKKEQWKPPEEGWRKINTDASVDVNGRSSVIGLVARDHGGDLLLARGRRLLGVTGPYCAELLGVREAVRLAMEKG